MGMGEPLNNYDNVKKAIECMIDPQRFGLSPRHVSVSTVGVVKNMHRMTDELPAVNLALSLHAPNQETRLRIVPAASAHKIDKLMIAIDNHIARNVHGPRIFTSRTSRKRAAEASAAAETAADETAATAAEDATTEAEDATTEAEDATTEAAAPGAGAGKRARSLEKWTGVMIEYILIDGINDSETHAHELGALLSANNDRRAHIIVNLIPYNPTDVAEDYHPPTPENVERFAAICCGEPYRLKTRVRKEMGQDIAGACGQLALVTAAPVGSGAAATSVRDVEDTLPSSSSSQKRSKTVAVRNGAERAGGGSGSGNGSGSSSSCGSSSKKSDSESNRNFTLLVSWQAGVAVLSISAIVGMALWGRKSAMRR